MKKLEKKSKNTEISENKVQIKCVTPQDRVLSYHTGTGPDEPRVSMQHGGDTGHG